MNSLEQAIKSLCDIGFYKMDAPFGHKLAIIPEASWTLRQRRAAWAMLRKYRGQLSDLGIDYSAIPEPPQLDPAEKKPDRLITIDDAGYVRFRFPYDPALVSAVKTIPGARFDGAKKNWYLKLSRDNAEAILGFAVRRDFDFSDKLVDRIDALSVEYAEKLEASRAKEAELEISGLGGELRPFQRAGVAYAARAKRTFVCDEMGLGKTIEALAVLQAEQAFPAVIVCPASLKLNWKREAEKWLPGKKVAIVNGGKNGGGWERGDIVILNYDVLKKNLEALQAMAPKAIVFDESHYCFPAGTMIRTDRGDLPIEQIVDNRLSLSVLSYNSYSNALEYKPIEDWLIYPLYIHLVRIKHEQGELICTKDHQVWTEDGYMEASALTSGVRLRVVPMFIPDAEEGEVHGTLLQSELCCSAYKQFATGQRENFGGASQTNGGKNLSLVSKKIFSSFKRENNDDKAFLWQFMCSIMAHESFASEETICLGNKEGSGNKSWEKMSRYFRKNETKQSNVQSRYIGKDAPVYARENVSFSWGQWSPNRATEASCCINRTSNGISYSHGSSQTSLSLTAQLLQGRFGQSNNKTCHRSRWVYTQNQALEISGPEKNGSFECSRVVNVEILQRGSNERDRSGNCQNPRVYCLSIADNENFFANGVLVSNCKNYKAARTEAAKALAKGIPIRLALTGTPVLNRPQELLSQLQILGRLEEMGGFWKFAERYCLPSDAPVLMADLTEKPIGQVKAGDKVVGWSRLPARYRQDTEPNRRLVESEVLDILKRESVLQEVELEDGTCIVCTPDHRWLNGRGEHGNSELEYSEAHTGRLGGRGRGCASRIVKIFRPPTPQYSGDDYSLGYLLGLMRGDGWCSQVIHEKHEPFRNKISRGIKRSSVGVATKDIECIDRAENYMKHFGLNPRRYLADGLYRLESSKSESYEFVSRIKLETDAQFAGFLGGIYDAEGSGQIISQSLDVNPKTFDLIEQALQRFSLSYKTAKDRKGIRLQGGRETILRFWAIASPALTRKLKAYIFHAGGRFTEGGIGLRDTPFVKSIRPLSSRHTVYTLTTTTGNYVAYGCGSKNCNAHKTRFGWDFSGATNLEELNERLRATCFVRRTKQEVLTELPPKSRAVVPIEIDNRREYDRAEKDVVAWLGQQAAKEEAFLASVASLSPSEQARAISERRMGAEETAARAEQLVRIEALKQLSAKGKLEAVSEWVESFSETGEKLVIFAHHQAVVEELAQRFNAPSITGQTSVERRQEYVDRFQTDPACRVIVCNIKAGGVGLTLTAASNVAFVELEWTPAAHDQAEDRCHRIGQTDSVTAWYLLGQGTIDEEIMALIEGKRIVVDAATEGREPLVGIGILSELISRLQGQRGKKEAKK